MDLILDNAPIELKIAFASSKPSKVIDKIRNLITVEEMSV